jgi:hypothetical protein
MNEFENDPFVCVEVENFNNPLNLAKRFEELFPRRIVRLKINNKYTPYFYLGSGVWIYNSFSKKTDLNYKICLEELPSDLFNEELFEIIKFFDINFEKLKILSNLIVKDEEFCGYFFSDGKNHIFDQFIFHDCDKVKTIFEQHLNAKVILDATNDNEDGFIILNTDIIL